jgi:hypothetical protein
MSDDGVMFPKISFARHVLRLWSTPESLRLFWPNYHNANGELGLRFHPV